MKEEIIKYLRQIEKEEDIKILYACESGSRSWGFEHENSDYDVRFIFKRNNLTDYLCLEKKKEEIIIIKGEIDLFGWDIRKVLLLHYDNNPEIREWLISEDVYIKMDKDYFEGISDFDNSGLMKHYFSIVNGDLDRKHRGKKERKLKRRLYDIRCIISWMILEKGLSPKIKILELIEQIELEDKLKDNIKKMIKDHKSQNETIKKDNLRFIDNWINGCYNMMMEKNDNLISKKKDKELYDNILL